MIQKRKKQTRANFRQTKQKNKQTDEHEVKTTFFSTFDFSLLIVENDTNDDEFSLAKFSKIEEKFKNTTNSEINSQKKSRSNHRIHNRNERLSTQKTQQKDKRHTRILFSDFFQNRILIFFFNLSLSKTTTNQRIPQNK